MNGPTLGDHEIEIQTGQRVIERRDHNMQVDIYYGNEFIATGTKRYSPWSGWTFIVPDRNLLDYDRVLSRLKEIEDTEGVRFEQGIESLGFPPRYGVIRHEGLT